MRSLALMLITLLGLALVAGSFTSDPVQADPAAQSVITLTPSPGGPTLTPLPALPTSTFGPVASYTFAPFVTQTPIATLTFGPWPTEPACAEPLRLRQGDAVTLTPGVNLRHLPSLSGAITNYYTEEVLLTVIDGPRCSGGYNWWFVSGVGEPGWVIEGRPGRYFLNYVAPTPEWTCYPPLPLRPGLSVRLITGLQMHADPSMDALVITVAPANLQTQILEGPVCREDVNWYRIAVSVVGADEPVDGWVVEGYPDEYLLEPMYLPTPTLWCARPLRLDYGTRVAVTYSDRVPRRLRAFPSSDSVVVQELLANVALELIGGPICSEGYNWWNVQVVGTSLTGWIAEGLPGRYWFDVIYEPGEE